MLNIQHNKPLYRENYFFRTRDLTVKNDSFHIYTYFESEYKPLYSSTSSEDSFFYNLFSVLEGALEYTSPEGEKYILTPGSIVLSSLRKGSRYRTIGKIPCKRKCFLIFKTTFTRKLFSCFFPDEKFCIFSPPEKAAILIQKLQEEFCRTDFEEEQVHLLGLITELLEILRTSFNEKELPENFLKILSFVESRLYNPDLKRKSIAAEASISLSTLDRLFLKHIHQSVSQYILEKRFAKVENLLALSGVRIKEIASGTGFASAIHMNFLFRKKYGMTPSQYRKKLFLSSSPYLQVE